MIQSLINNTVLASGIQFNLNLWNIQTALYLSVLKFKKQTNQQQKRGRQLYKDQLHNGLISYLSPSITRLIFQCFPRPFESLSSRLALLFTLETSRYNHQYIDEAGENFRSHTTLGHALHLSISLKFWHKVQTP